jgi:hypothetical protein
MPSYLPVCPPVKYSENKNISNFSTNQPASLGTKVSIYSRNLQNPVGKKMHFVTLAIDAFGSIQGTPGGSKNIIRNTFG